MSRRTQRPERTERAGRTERAERAGRSERTERTERAERAGHTTAPQRLARLTRLVPAQSTGAARTPFVLLIVVLLGSGLLALLLLNASVNQGSFELSKLKKQTKELTDEEQALKEDVDAYSAPAALDRRARELGLVPGGTPAFLLPDGSVRGVPKPAPNPGR